MVRTSRRLKEKRADQKPQGKYISEIYLVHLKVDDYESTMGKYLYDRLSNKFDDESLNISFREGNITEDKEIPGYYLECQPDKDIPEYIIDKEFRAAYADWEKLYKGIRRPSVLP